jgi:hypothetical protein
MDETIQRNILHELRIIKKLLAHNLLTGDSQAKQISELDSIGFQPREIVTPDVNSGHETFSHAATCLITCLA